jgi:hypothetical protein
MDRTTKWFYYGMDAAEKRYHIRWKAWHDLIKFNLEFKNILPKELETYQ